MNSGDELLIKPSDEAAAIFDPAGWEVTGVAAILDDFDVNTVTLEKVSREAYKYAITHVKSYVNTGRKVARLTKSYGRTVSKDSQLSSKTVST